jgi:hypothetical protein
MNVIHRIGFSTNRHDVLNYFTTLGIKKKESGTVLTFEIGENDKEWDKAHNFINDHRNRDKNTPSAFFTPGIILRRE